MRALVRGLALRRLRLEPGRTLLLVLGVALGVAVFVAVRGLNRTALQSLGRLGEVATGAAALEVEGGSAGVPLDLLEKVRKIEGVRAATPVLARFAREALQSGGGDTGEASTRRVLVLGLDLLDASSRDAYAQASNAVKVPNPALFLMSKNATIVSDAFAKSRRLEPGSTFELFLASGRETFTVAGTFTPEGPLAQAVGGDAIVVPIQLAMRAFGTEGRADRFEVAVNKDADSSDVARRLREALPKALTTRAPGSQETSSQALLGTMQLGLELASLLSLIIGQFLIYNAMSIAVVRRRPEIGVLRAVGTTKKQLAFLILAESAAFGIAGSALGIGLGVLLGHAALGAVSAQVSQLYGTLDARAITLGPGDWALGLIAGPIATVLATIPPVYQALTVSPVEAARQDLPRTDPRRAILQFALAGLAVLVASGVVFFAFDQGFSYYGGALLEGGISLGAALLAPWGVLTMAGHARPIFAWLLGPPGALAGESVLKRPGRAGVTVAALMVALGGVFSIASLVESLKAKIHAWVENVLVADVYCAASTPLGSQANTLLLASVAGELESVDGVERAYPIRFVFEEVEERKGASLAKTHPALVISVDMEFLGDKAHLAAVDSVPGGIPAAVALIGEGDAVAITRNMARLRGFSVGDRIAIRTPGGEWAPRVALILDDFTSEHGVIYLHRKSYQQRWGDLRANAFDVFVKPGFDRSKVTEDLRRRFGARYDLFFTENAAFRARVLGVVESVFSVTYAMEIIAIAVALLGVVTTLFAAILERTREVGVLRAIGASRGQIRVSVMAEAFLLGAVASGFACVVGAGLGVVLVKRVISGTYGFELDFVFPVRSAVFGVVAATVLATIAGCLPAARAARIKIVEALAYQ